jgi:hypothetical protein
MERGSRGPSPEIFRVPEQFRVWGIPKEDIHVLSIALQKAREHGDGLSS